MQREHNSAYPLAESFAATAVNTGKYSCPECTPDRSNQKRLDLQVTIEPDKTLYQCHHCDAHKNYLTN